MPRSRLGSRAGGGLSSYHLPAKADFGSQVGFPIATQIVTKNSNWMKTSILKSSVNFRCSWAQTVKTGSLTNLGIFFSDWLIRKLDCIKCISYMKWFFLKISYHRKKDFDHIFHAYYSPQPTLVFWNHLYFRDISKQDSFLSELSQWILSAQKCWWENFLANFCTFLEFFMISTPSSFLSLLKIFLCKKMFSHLLVAERSSDVIWVCFRAEKFYQSRQQWRSSN